MATPLPPCTLVRAGPWLIGRRGSGFVQRLDDPGELVDACREPLEAGFEPVERSERTVHDHSLRSLARGRIRKRRPERCGKATAADRGRTLNGDSIVASVVKDSPHPRLEVWELPQPGLPLPTPPFRRRAWLLFQRALDPLAPPKPLPLTPAQRRRGHA